MLYYLKRLAQASALTFVVTFMTLFLLQRPNQNNTDGQTFTPETALLIMQKWKTLPKWSDHNQSDFYTDSDLLNNSIADVETSEKSQLSSERMTATPRTFTTTLDDIFISVKTTKNYHSLRLPVILATWFRLAKHQTWFFTDSAEDRYQKMTGGRMINTNCSSSHNRKALCCKMSVEFDTFLETDKKWFCHFDDDNYVNIPRLVKILQNYSPQSEWYLGKPSIRAPLQILDREHNNNKRNISFWFATGGAGFCLSRALTLKMVPIASGGKFMSIGDKIRLPDDVTMGYIIEYLLGKPLTVIEEFHSHLEPMKFLRDSFDKQITFSYSQYGKDEMNILKIDGFDLTIDPTRFRSLHCFLFPNIKYCPR